MSEYAEIANRIMDVIGNFDALNELASEDVDIAFFAKMDLTAALTKAVAGVKEEQEYPLKTIKPKPPLPKNKYFYSVDSKGLWVASESSIYHKEKSSTSWANVSDIWDTWGDLYSCSDIIMLTYDDYLKKLGDIKSAPNDIPF